MHQTQILQAMQFSYSIRSGQEQVTTERKLSRRLVEFTGCKNATGFLVNARAEIQCSVALLNENIRLICGRYEIAAPEDVSNFDSIEPQEAPAEKEDSSQVVSQQRTL